MTAATAVDSARAVPAGETRGVTSSPVPPSDQPLATDLPVLDGGVRLVVADMDGTLLDAHGEVPAGLWPLLERMRAAGVVFAPASGRQHATLARMFADLGDDLVVIAENGSYVARGGVEVSSVTLDRPLVEDAVGVVRDLAAGGADVGVVVCGKTSAYVERFDDGFLRHVEPYYLRLERVADLLEVEDEVLKVAVFDVDGAEPTTAAALARFRETHQVVVSGRFWVDIMQADINKGVALRSLQAELGVTRAETVVFGDYLNDLEMLDEADASFAMANAHPDVLARARYRAPSNADHGVITTLTRLLDQHGA